MKLTPKARPVKIHIRCGGVEHSNLSSLKEHFSIPEVFRMIEDKRLIRWLKQCGENTLAKAIEGTDISNKREILTLFFPEYKKLPSLDFFKFLYGNGEKETAIAIFNKELKEDINAVKVAWEENVEELDFQSLFDQFYKKDETLCNTYLRACVDGKLTPSEGFVLYAWTQNLVGLDFQRWFDKLWEKDKEISFYYAKGGIEKKFNIADKKIYTLFNNALQLGSEKAKQFKKNNVWKEFEQNFSRYPSIDIEATREAVRKTFAEKTTTFVPKSDGEKEAIAFAEDCLIICKKLSTTSDAIKAVDLFTSEKRKGNNLFAPEYELVFSLVKRSMDSSSDWQKSLKNKSVEHTTLVQYVLKNSESFPINLKEGVAFLIQHLFDSSIKQGGVEEKEEEVEKPQEVETSHKLEEGDKGTQKEAPAEEVVETAEPEVVVPVSPEHRFDNIDVKKVKDDFVNVFRGINISRINTRNTDEKQAVKFAYDCYRAVYKFTGTKERDMFVSSMIEKLPKNELLFLPEYELVVALYNRWRGKNVFETNDLEKHKEMSSLVRYVLENIDTFPQHFRKGVDFVITHLFDKEIK